MKVIYNAMSTYFPKFSLSKIVCGNSYPYVSGKIMTREPAVKPRTAKIRRGNGFEILD